MAIDQYGKLILLGAAALVGLLCISPSAQAQTLEDAVKQHLREGLEKPKEKPAEKAQEPKSRPAADTAQKKTEPKKAESKPAEPSAKKPRQPSKPAGKGQGSGVSFTVGEEKKVEEKGPQLPLRVIGENLKIDITLGGGYRGWAPQQYPTVDVDMASYFTWTIDVKAKIYRWLNLRRGYYESSGLSGPRTSGADSAAKVGSYAPKAAWLLGVIGFPYFKVWEPIIRYETRAFQTRAKPSRPVCVVGTDQGGELKDCPMSTETLRIVSGFETLVAGVRYNHDKDPSPVIHTPKGKVPPIFFGIGLMSYTKPYQVTVNGDVLNDYLFDGRFRGIGLAGGTELGGGIDRFYADIYAQFGMGEIKLTHKLTLNELAPKGWMIGYAQGDVTVGYRWPFWRFAPTLLLVPEITGGGAAFFFFKAWYKEGEKANTPAINWDFLWTARCSLVLSL